MHFDNQSSFVDDVLRLNLTPTPVCDKLSMVWRPGAHKKAKHALLFL